MIKTVGAENDVAYNTRGIDGMSGYLDIQSCTRGYSRCGDDAKNRPFHNGIIGQLRIFSALYQRQCFLVAHRIRYGIWKSVEVGIPSNSVGGSLTE